MSNGNAQAARDYLAAFNRGDLDAGLKHFDRYAVVRFDPKWPENRPRFGIEEIRSYFEDLVATFGTGDGIIEVEYFLDFDEALEAIGLSK
jgi:ketosteroid isomerase-like protein